MDLNGIGKVGDRVSEGQTAGVHGTGFATGSLTGIIQGDQELRLVLTGVDRG